MTCIEPESLWEVVENTRYKNKNIFFTAGDENQFETHRSFNNGLLVVPEEQQNEEPKGLPPYEINTFSVTDTFNYIFNRLKKGIFVRIIDNKVETFLPFSKQNYINNWSQYIKIDKTAVDPRTTGLTFMDNFLKDITERNNFYNNQSYVYDPKRTCKFRDKWYANNCLLRYEWPMKVADTNATEIRHMLDTLCLEKKIKNIEFFINKRDFPLLTNNLTEPYFHIFGYDVPLQNFHFKGICPILSMCTSSLYADIAIPTHEDWSRVNSIEDRVLFPPSCKDYLYDFSTPWDQRKPTAVFRGASTGCGVSSKEGPLFNQRLKLANISMKTKTDKYGVPLIDAGITKWNLRPRKIINVQYLKTIDPSEEACTVKPLTPEQQSKYKYIINVDGHVSAFRLSLEMSMGSCIIIVESLYGWKMWFSHLLVPYVHYIPVKSDLTDLVEKIKWCRENDSECKKIASNAKQFSDKYLTKKGIINHMANLLNDLHDKLGVAYYKESPLVKQEKIELNWLNLRNK